MPLDLQPEIDPCEIVAGLRNKRSRAVALTSMHCAIRSYLSFVESHVPEEEKSKARSHGRTLENLIKLLCIDACKRNEDSDEGVSVDDLDDTIELQMRIEELACDNEDKSDAEALLVIIEECNQREQKTRNNAKIQDKKDELVITELQKKNEELQSQLENSEFSIVQMIAEHNRLLANAQSMIDDLAEENKQLQKTLAQVQVQKSSRSSRFIENSWDALRRPTISSMWQLTKVTTNATDDSTDSSSPETAEF